MIKLIVRSGLVCFIWGTTVLSSLLSCTSSGNSAVDERELKGFFSVKGVDNKLEGSSSTEYFKATEELSILCKDPDSGDFVQVVFKNERSAHSEASFRLVKAFKNISDTKLDDEVDFTYYSDGKFYYSDGNSTGEVKTENKGSKYTITFGNVSVINIPDKEVKYISGSIDY